MTVRAELAELIATMPANDRRTDPIAWDEDCGAFIEKHHAALAAAVEDAGRYRWLRDADIGRQISVYADDDGNTWLHTESLDAAIDAARATQCEGEG